MKKYLLWMLTGILGLGVISCEDDNDSYSLDKYWIDFGIVIDQGNDHMDYTIKVDDGDILYPVNSNASLSDLEDGDRVLVNYTVLSHKNSLDGYDEYYVEINSWRGILMKGILDITPANEDSIGNDPVNVENVWVSNNLLNFKLSYWGFDQTHFINLVKQPGELTEAGQPFQLELRHNNNNDQEEVLYTAYVSFDLSALKLPSVDSVQFTVNGIQYGNEGFTYDGVFNYSGN